MKRLLLIAVISLFVSCDDTVIMPEDIVSEADGLLLKRAVYNYEGEIYDAVHNYDGNRLLSIIDEVRGIEELFTYDDDKLIRIDYKWPFGDAFTSLSYNEDGSIAVIEMWSVESNSFGEYTFIYNNDNTITRFWEGITTDTITLDSNGNIISVDDNDGLEYIFTYDNYNGRYKNVAFAPLLNLLSAITEFGYDNFQNCGINNATSFREVYKGEGYTEYMSYTYNELGYPITMTNYDDEEVFGSAEFYYE